MHRATATAVAAPQKKDRVAKLHYITTSETAVTTFSKSCTAAMKGVIATSISIWKDLNDRIPMPFIACRNSISVESYEALKFAIFGLECCHLPSSAASSSSSSPSNAAY